MIEAVLFVLAATSISQSPSALQWAGCFGQVSVYDAAGQPLAMRLGQSLGDATLTSGEESGAVLFQSSQVCVHVGSRADVDVSGQQGRTRLVVRRGETRVAVMDSARLLLETPLATTAASGCVMRTQVAPDHVLFRVDRGNAEIRLTDAGLSTSATQRIRRVVYFESDPDVLPLVAGQQVVVTAGSGFGDVEDIDENDWEIDPDFWLIRLSRSDCRPGAEDVPDLRSEPPVPQPADLTAQQAADAAGSQSAPFNNQVATTSGVNLTLGPTLASTGLSGAAVNFTDANQDSLAGQLTTDFRGLNAGAAFPGNIHLVTGETAYVFDSVTLAAGDDFLPDGVTPQYWSIGRLDDPANPTQIVTSFGTGTSTNPTVIDIPTSAGLSLIHLDQYPIADPRDPSTTGNPLIGVAGLLGTDPTAPQIQGANSTDDHRAQFNRGATFALGEFAVRQMGDTPEISMRRSDQDRQIVKDPDGNDVNDQITPNSDVAAFTRVPDPRFLPQNREVFVPVTGPEALGNRPRFSTSNMTRRAAFTVLTAEKLKGFAQRTGNTRFVVDGQIIDITGYRP